MSEQDKEETPIFTDLGRQQEDGHAIHHPDTDHGVEFEDWGDIIDWDRVLTQAGAGILDLPEPVKDADPEWVATGGAAEWVASALREAGVEKLDFPVIGVDLSKAITHPVTEPVPVNGASDWEMGVSSVSYPEEEK